MRSLYHLFAIILLAAETAPAQLSSPPSEEELAQLRRLEPQRAQEGLQYLNTTRERYGLDSRHTFRHVNSTTDMFGVFHGRYRQYFNGVRVAGGNAIVHIGRNGQVERPTTKLYDALSLPTTPVVSEQEAIAKALAAVNPGGRLTGLETSAVELLIHLETATVDRGEPASGHLAANPRYRRYEEVVRSHQLAWHVMVSSDESEFQPRILLIDANNGLVMKSLDAADNETVNATGTGFFHGPRKFRTITQEGTFKAVDPDRGDEAGNVFLNANHTAHTSYKKYWAYTDANNHWGNGKFDDGSNPTDSETSKSAVTDAYYAVGQAWDLLGLMGRNGWDNGGRRLFIRMHYGSGYNDAKFQTGGLAKNEGMFLGDGSGSTALRTVAHELGHGFFHSIFGWTYKPNQEWAGLNEGNSDIFGTLTELYAYKAPGETKRYTDMEGEWRWHDRMINPLGYSPDDDKTFGYRYWEPGLGNKEEHNVGCLYGHMFIFLADGASSDPNSPLYSKFVPSGFSGIGVEKAALYWSRAMIHYLPEKGDFFDLREAFLDAAGSPFTPKGVRAAIATAFTAIGVGYLSENTPDTENPQITEVIINRLDEAAGFLELAVTATDMNMARIEVMLDGKLAFTDYRLPYGGPVNLIGLAPGTHSITVRAYDIFGHMSSTIRNFSLNGVRNLIVNGGFEENSSWSSTGGQTSTNPDLAFAGNRYARITAGGAIWQAVTIPADATNVRLLYRVRAENHSETGFLDSELLVRLLNESGKGVIQNLATHQEGVETFENALTKTYRQMSIGGITHRGPARVSFQMNGGTTQHRFKVDNVALIYDLPTKAVVQALVRDGEESVELSTVLTGFDPASISHVSYYLDDAYEKGLAPVATGYAPDFRKIVSTSGLSKKQHAVVASVRYKNNAEAAKAGVYFNVATVNNLISNGDFENGYQNWPVTGGTWMLQPALDAPNRCFLGVRCALLGMALGFPKTTAEQYLTMPAFPQSAALTYRLKVETKEANPNLKSDTFRVYLVDATNKKWQIGDTYSNATDTNGWMLVQESLPQGLLKAGNLHLIIESQQNNVNRTDFLVDNVSLVVKQLGIQLP